jgi:hypothetical protein
MRFKNVWRGLVAVVERLIRPSKRPRAKHTIARFGPDPGAVENIVPIGEVVVEVHTPDTSDTVSPEELDALDHAIEIQEESSPITDFMPFGEAEIPNLQEGAISEVASVQIEIDESDDSPLLTAEDIFPLHEDVEIDIEIEETVPDQSGSGIQLELPHWESLPQTTEHEESAEPPPSESFGTILLEDVAASLKTPTHRRPKPVVMPSFDFSQHPRISKQELREFLRLAELGALDSMPSLTARRIDALLMEALREVDLIGELPISKAAFNQMTDVMRREFVVSHRLSIKRVWPALFVTSMVFCARYSEETDRNFWTPYARLVWNLPAASQAFQNQCRRHFAECRKWLTREYGLDFPVIPEYPGSVVRPVFYHAVIPFYLQDNFARWLSENLERLREYDAASMPVVLRTDPSLVYVVPTLRRFLQDEETIHTAAELIAHLNEAARLFLEGEEDVAALMINPIQRALWKEIELVLTEKVARENIRRVRQPKLTWIWSLEDSELMLRLTNVSAEPGHQPDVCVWTDKARVDLARSDVLERVSPWRRPDGRWFVDEVLVADGPSDGRVYVLSVEHDDDAPDVVYQAEVPPLPSDPVVFFRVGRGDWGTWVDHHRVTDGKWLVSMAADVEIVGEDGQPCQWVESKYLPNTLREHAGHARAGIVNLVLPVVVFYKGHELFRIERQPGSVGQPWVDGPHMVPDLSSHIPPVFTDWPVKLTIPFSEADRLKRITLTIRSSGRIHVAQPLDEMLERGTLEITPDGGKVVLNEIVPETAGVYIVDLRRGLQSLLDEPVQFAVLPGISLQPPDFDRLYSPTCLPTAYIGGIRPEQAVVPHGVECQPEASGVKIIWRDLRQPECSLRLSISNEQVPLAWPIRRVWAWVDGLGSDGSLRAKLRNEAQIHVRGPRDQWLAWRITNDSQERPFKLGAWGESDFILAQDQLIEMIEHCPQTHVTVNLSAGEDEWKLFEYVRKPDVQVRHAKYDADAKQLLLDCQVGHVREGDFRLQLVDSRNPDDAPIFEQYFTRFENSLRFKCELKAREYRIQLFSKEEPLELEPSVALLEVGGQIPSIQISPQKSRQSDMLMLPGSAYQSMLSDQHDSLSSIFRCLAEINKPLDWIQTYGLLPAWAVTGHPLMLTTREHRIGLLVYPEIAAFKGRAGKGYMDIKLEDDVQTRVYATWEPLVTAENALYSSQLKLMIPTSEVSGPFSLLDEYDLWPAYQCSYCGRIVGSRSGNYLKLSPSTLHMHQHGKKYQDKRERFRDIVYGYDLHVSVTSLKREQLNYVFSPRQIIDSNYLLENLNTPPKAVVLERSSPIAVEAYRRATRQWLEYYHMGHQQTTDRDRKWYGSHSFSARYKPDLLKQLVANQKWRTGFDKLECSRSTISTEPMLAAANRLLDSIRSRPSQKNPLIWLDRNMLLLALLFRTHASAPQTHKVLWHESGFTNSDLHEMLSLALESCPLLLQWAITWVELFRVHAIS